MTNELTNTSAIDAAVGRGRLAPSLRIEALWDAGPGRDIEPDLAGRCRTNPCARGIWESDAC